MFLDFSHSSHKIHIHTYIYIYWKIKMVNWKDFWTTKTLVGLGLGQFLSLLITSTGFSSSELAKKGPHSCWCLWSYHCSIISLELFVLSWIFLFLCLVSSVIHCNNWAICLIFSWDIYFYIKLSMPFCTFTRIQWVFIIYIYIYIFYIFVH